MHNWTNDERMMIACCNDGTRPVIFKIERIDIPETKRKNSGLLSRISRIRQRTPIQAEQRAGFPFRFPRQAPPPAALRAYPYTAWTPGAAAPFLRLPFGAVGGFSPGSFAGRADIAPAGFLPWAERDDFPSNLVALQLVPADLIIQSRHVEGVPGELFEGHSDHPFPAAAAPATAVRLPKAAIL